MARRRILLPALAAGGLWWWAVLRLALAPEHAGVIEGAVAAGGWGLSLLPVHAAARPSVRPGKGAAVVEHPGRPEGVGGPGGSQGTGPSWQRGHQ
ncbi:hypothetical protein [Streptomyces sp. IB2014 016-6]|uniref:hypothetical protein n=1 Tax=Streptomyces sp. IB2014 016-6 TaxID=2517818 RepID=UPI0011C8D436|nr:hypothetical protein [Streptomyces sp. IB2014 016-6]TXL85194.1 hypothetical protein EW053_31875 [Streptomyces sp. IB2014 016-6]